jgi:opacity protein-like surface antigen
MRIVTGVLSWAAAAIISTAATAEPSFYFGAAYIFADVMGRSGGFNTAGPHTNFDCTGPAPAFGDFPTACTNQDRGSGWSVFGGVGGINANDPISVRFEGEFTRYPHSQFVTGSFPGAPTPTFWYRTGVDVRAAFANVYVDATVSERVTLFLGGGVGAAFIGITTDDTIVQGTAQNTNFAFNVGVGAMLNIAPRVAIIGQTRVVNFGQAETALNVILGGAPAGNYTLSLSALELRVGLVIMSR